MQCTRKRKYYLWDLYVLARNIACTYCACLHSSLVFHWYFSLMFRHPWEFVFSEEMCAISLCEELFFLNCVFCLDSLGFVSFRSCVGVVCVCVTVFLCVAGCTHSSPLSLAVPVPDCTSCQHASTPTKWVINPWALTPFLWQNVLLSFFPPPSVSFSAVTFPSLSKAVSL